MKARDSYENSSSSRGRKSHESRAPSSEEYLCSPGLGRTERGTANRPWVERRREGSRRVVRPQHTRALSDGFASPRQPGGCGRSSAGRAAFRVSQSAKVRAPFTILDLADEDRHQRSIDAPPQQAFSSGSLAG